MSETGSLSTPMHKRLNFWRCIYGPLKLPTSNLVHTLGLGLAYQKRRLGPKLAGVWARGATEKNWAPIFISATVEASN